MAIPTAPSTCFAESTSPTTATVYWTDNSSDEVGFKIERSLTAGSGFTEIGQEANGVTTFYDTGRSAATRYFYRVRAFNADGNSNSSSSYNSDHNKYCAANDNIGIYYSDVTTCIIN